MMKITIVERHPPPNHQAAAPARHPRPGPSISPPASIDTGSDLKSGTGFPPGESHAQIVRLTQAEPEPATYELFDLCRFLLRQLFFFRAFHARTERFLLFVAQDLLRFLEHLAFFFLD